MFDLLRMLHSKFVFYSSLIFKTFFFIEIESLLLLVVYFYYLVHGIVLLHRYDYDLFGYDYVWQNLIIWVWWYYCTLCYVCSASWSLVIHGGLLLILGCDNKYIRIYKLELWVSRVLFYFTRVFMSNKVVRGRWHWFWKTRTENRFW